MELTAAHSARPDAATFAEPVLPADTAQEPGGTLARLEALRRGGRFEEFIDAARNAVVEEPASAALEALRTEALLAGGANALAEDSAQRAATHALAAGDAPLAAQSLRLWVTARLRQGKPLASPAIGELAAQLPDDDIQTQLVRFWTAALAERKPYAADGADAAEPAEVPITKAADGTIWAELNAIEATANGVVLPMVFVDTGTQYAIMTRRAAESAGVEADDSGTQLVGFAGLEARPAVIETLALGGLTLHNVPVLVGDSPPLVAANGQMALGTELMHHVRFTLDYPERHVWAERSDRPSAHHNEDARWSIPLWTFSQACLTRADTPRGPARVLVDTGNRSGTYVSGRWAQQHFPRFQPPTSSLVFKFRHQGLALDTMELGNRVLTEWPIVDRIPSDLERLDIVDVLVGRDLLWPYRLTIDMRQRVMWLGGGPESPIPPAEWMP